MKIADLKPVLLPTRIEKIDKNLYRGNAIFSPIKALRLKRKGITQIIDLRNEDGLVVRVLKFLERFYCKILNIDYVQMSFFKNKEEKIPEKNFFDAINKQIKKSKETYLHCHFGEHRTGLAVAMYQKSKGISNDIIIQQLLKSRWRKEGTNFGREEILQAFLKKFFPS